MYLKLDGQGPVYAQLIRAMKAAILEGMLTAGSRLPSTRKLAEEFRVSRMTAVSAYEQLRAEGYIRSRVGSGCYVNALQIEPGMTAPDRGPVAPQSHYARRIRAVHNRDWPVARYRGLRFELEYGVPITEPALRVAWGRELSNAAKYPHASPPMNPQGLLALREQVCVYLGKRRGVHVRTEDILIINGAQQAFELTARVLLNEGDTVVMEDPHYYGMWEAFAAHGARLRPVPIDEEGLICASLPKRAPKLVCVTPSHQFPAGPVMSLPRRLELLHYARERRCWILEDDYDSEFRYDSRPLAALRQLDQGHQVIYVGTFSKMLFLGLRLGYLIPPASLKQDFINARILCDFTSRIIEESALANFMRNGGFERHLHRMDKTLRMRREALIDELQRRAGDRVRIADFHTGTHVVVWLPGYDHTRLNALIDYAEQRGLGLYSIAAHYRTPPATPGLLLSFGGLSAQELREAMRIFGECLDAIAAKRQKSRAAKRRRPAVKS